MISIPFTASFDLSSLSTRRLFHIRLEVGYKIESARRNGVLKAILRKLERVKNRQEAASCALDTSNCLGKYPDAYDNMSTDFITVHTPGRFVRDEEVSPAVTVEDELHGAAQILEKMVSEV